MNNNENNENNVNNVSNNFQMSSDEIRMVSDDVDRSQALIKEEHVVQNEQVVIPESFYEEKKQQEEAVMAANVENARISEQATQVGGKIFGFAFINLALFTVLINAYLNTNRMLIFAIPVIIVLFTFFCFSKDKKDNFYPQATLLSGVFGAAISIIIAMLDDKKMDYMMYFVTVYIVIAFLGGFVSNLVTNLFSKKENVNKFGSLIMLLIIFGGVGALYFIKPEFVTYTVFRDNATIKAKDEKSFVEKTLSQRYGNKFTCKDDTRSAVNQKGELYKTRSCYDKDDKEVVVQSVDYNKTELLYTVKDNYVAVKYLDELESKLETELANINGATSSTVSLYPKENCSFYGECAEVDEYFERYEIEADRDNAYKVSSKLNLSKEFKNTTAIDFANAMEFKYVITLSGAYSSMAGVNYDEIVNKTLEHLNSLGIKNNYGYVVTIKNASNLGGSTYNSAVYKVKGNTSNDKTFKDPIIEKLK